MTVSVTLPWPPEATSPNASGQGKWRRKSEAASSYKRTCWALCKAAGLSRMDADAVDVSVIFQPPSARRYDLDNQLARVKQGLDAVADAIGVDDSQWASMTLERGDKTPGGAVVVHVTPADWQPIGCAVTRLVNDAGRKRGNAAARNATANSEDSRMAQAEHSSVRGAAQ